MTYTLPTAEEIAQRRAELAPFDGWNERAFAQIVAWNGLPESYLDLGSGTGAMVNFARKMGIEAIGVDLINGPEHWFIAHDLSKPLTIAHGRVAAVSHENSEDYDTAHFALITCLEVAEHLPEDGGNELIATIARHMPVGGRLLFSAAPPGQHGEHHVTCRPAMYWRSKLYEYGISYREDYTRQLSHLFGWVTGPASAWIAANLQVFDR